MLKLKGALLIAKGPQVTSLWEKRLEHLQRQTSALIDATNELSSSLLVQTDEQRTFASENADKKIRSLTALITATGTSISLEEKTHTRLDIMNVAKAETVGTAEDKTQDESRFAAGPSLDLILEETARFAHSYLAERAVFTAPRTDAPDSGAAC